MKVLLVEDDPEVVTTISILFEIKFRKATIFTTHCGKKAIELFRNNDFDMVILDIGLPDTSGFTVLQEIRRSSSAPVIILTSDTDEESHNKALKMGANDFIVKPFGHIEFVNRVKEQIDARTLFGLMTPQNNLA